MTELLDIDPKEEDFECKEEFPGRVSIEGAFTGKSYYLTSQPLELLPICLKVIAEFKWRIYFVSHASVVLFTDVHTVKSLMEEMENDSSGDEMTEDEPAEQGIATRVIGKNRPQTMEH